MAFRKPQQRKQGLKILVYGEDGSGKSVFALSFPKIAFVDTESKVGVYENDPEYGKNLIGIADTAEYFEVIDLAENIIKNPKDYSTFVTDSETNLYDSMKVAVMEVEEEKARRYNKNVDDAIVGMRGWGKIGLNNARFKNLKVQLSALGITVISIAHKKDVYDQDNAGKKVGEKPDLKDTSKHDYDVILRFYIIKQGKVIKYFAEVEKDTSRTFKSGTQIENPSYNDWQEYIDSMSKLKGVTTNYDTAIDTNMDKASKNEAEKIKELKDEVIELCKDLGGTDNEKLMKLLHKYDTKAGNPNRIKSESKLKELLDKVQQMKNEQDKEKQDSQSEEEVEETDA